MFERTNLHFLTKVNTVYKLTSPTPLRSSNGAAVQFRSQYGSEKPGGGACTMVSGNWNNIIWHLFSSQNSTTHASCKQHGPLSPMPLSAAWRRRKPGDCRAACGRWSNDFCLCFVNKTDHSYTNRTSFGFTESKHRNSLNQTCNVNLLKPSGEFTYHQV
jgi:hypothetical protein